VDEVYLQRLEKERADHAKCERRERSDGDDDYVIGLHNEVS